jgi:predicted dehydrogenase
MNRLQIAFVGCGGIADHYLGVYRDLEFVEVATCIDADLRRAEMASAALAENRHAKPRPGATVDFAEALKDGIDVVIINTPNQLHCEQALAAFKANKHMLLQKPVAANLADAELIAEAAGEAGGRGIISGLYLSYFDQPMMYDLRGMIRNGWFGEISHLYARLMHRGGLSLSKEILSGRANWRGSLKQTGGGCFIQLAIHYLHLFKWMMDARVVRVSAVTKNLYCPGIEGEDLACAILEFSNGALATIDMAWNTASEQLGVHGTLGSCEYIGNRMLLLDSLKGDFIGHAIEYIGRSDQASPGAPGAVSTHQMTEVIAPRLDDINNPFNQHRMFLESVRDKREAFVSIESGVDDLRVVQAVYQSSVAGCAVSL